MVQTKTVFFLFYLILFFASSTATCQAVQWTDITSALKNNEGHVKKIFLKIDQPNCEACDLLSFTLSKPTLTPILKQNFYCVKSDGSKNLDLLIEALNSKSLKNYQGLEQISKDIKENKIALPIIVFINEELEIIQKFEGIKSESELEKITLYFGKNFYKKVPWPKFNKNFNDYKNK